jgi:hypothetical protein
VSRVLVARVIEDDDPEFSEQIKGAQVLGCPFCGQSVWINLATKRVLHNAIDDCQRFGAHMVTLSGFEEAVAWLNRSAVRA